ncbi:integrase [Pandoraea pneumonica]|uniref:Integrase n=1 Tax=Pandoraea pneumonica TaxID=2508299 RepID=A0A5E4WV76_9BURK|nr:tyrosine-type recombinase/integrase [Pandoraea pneumonica]VVE28717.1 integrase [Pandoraea pneumonica]
MATKRLRGSTWEYVVKRSALLPKPIYLRFESEAEGDEYVRRLEALLDAGVVPEEFAPTAAGKLTLAELNRAYQVALHVPDEDRALLNVIHARLGKTPLLTLDYKWVERWVSDMKREQNLAPSTIRHYVGALSRCFAWACRSGQYPELVINPLGLLPKRYATYSDADVAYLAAVGKGKAAKRDESREQRLDAKQEAAIRAVLNGEKREDRERPLALAYRAALECMFDLALETAMRMREIFTLSQDQIDIAARTIFLDKTKNGDRRQVPLSSVAVRVLGEYLAHVDGGTRGMEGYAADVRLFPWWSGEVSRVELARVTSLLSRQYSRVFDMAKCGEIRFHDLRHEATSRLYERTQLSDLQISKITGHKDPRMLSRYANLRASNLATHLW